MRHYRPTARSNHRSLFAFLLAGRILEPGESIAHPSGWRLESVEADERKMIRMRLHAPEGTELAEA